MVTSWLVLLLTALLLPATWSGTQQTGDRSKGEIFSVLVHIYVNGIHYWLGDILPQDILPQRTKCPKTKCPMDILPQDILPQIAQTF